MAKMPLLDMCSHYFCIYVSLQWISHLFYTICDKHVNFPTFSIASTKILCFFMFFVRHIISFGSSLTKTHPALGNCCFALLFVQVRYLSIFGAATLTDTVCGIMKTLMTNSIATQYNWLGKGKKNSFAELQLAPIICGKLN